MGPDSNTSGGPVPIRSRVVGRRPDPSADRNRRWEDYASAQVRADVAPGQWTIISGPGALEVWPYPGTIHVITACNPFGRIRPEGVNQHANDELARQLLDRGANIQRSIGSDIADGYSEAGFLTWDLSRRDAVELGAAFDQEAIYEIDARETHVVSCADDRVVTASRVRPRAAANDDRPSDERSAGS